MNEFVEAMKLMDGKVSKPRKPEHSWELSQRPADTDLWVYTDTRVGWHWGPKARAWFECKDCGAVGYALDVEHPVQPWLEGPCGFRFNSWPPKVAPVGYTLDERGIPVARSWERGWTPGERAAYGGLDDDTLLMDEFERKWEATFPPLY